MPSQSPTPNVQEDDPIAARELRAWIADLAVHPHVVESAWISRNLPLNTGWMEEALPLDDESQVPYWFLWAPVRHPATAEPLSLALRRAWLLWLLAGHLSPDIRNADPAARRRQLAQALSLLSYEAHEIQDWPFPDDRELTRWL